MKRKYSDELIEGFRDWILNNPKARKREVLRAGKAMVKSWNKATAVELEIRNSKRDAKPPSKNRPTPLPLVAAKLRELARDVRRHSR